MFHKSKRMVSSRRADLETVRQRYNATGPSVEVPADYLEGANAVWFVDERGATVGQYLVKRGPGLRYLGMIPEGERPDFLSQENACEITCFWLDPQLARGERTQIYFRMQFDVATLGGREWVLVATEREKLRGRYRYLYNREIWVGRPANSPSVWYIDGLERRKVLPGLLVRGVLRFSFLQLVRNRAKIGHGHSQGGLA